MEKKYSVQHNIEINQRKKEKIYWQNKLSNDYKKTIIPYDNLNSRSKGRDKYIKIEFPVDLSQKVCKLGDNSEPRMLVVLSSCLTLLLSELNYNEKQILFGLPVYNVGVNPSLINSIIPIVINFEESWTFKTLLNNVKKTIKEGLDNFAYPIHLMAEFIGYQVDNDSSFPVFDIALGFKDLQEKQHLEDLDFNIYFEFSFCNNNLQLYIYYNSSCYNYNSIIEIGELYINTINDAIKDLDQNISSLDIIPLNQTQKILNEFNNTYDDLKNNNTVIDYFVKRAKDSPDNIALVLNDENLSYGALNEKSDLVYKTLLSRGISENSVVAIIGDQTLELFIGIIGILKAGAAYLAIDKSHPKQRIDYMIKDSHVKWIMGDSNDLLLINNEEVIKIDISYILKEQSGNEYIFPKVNLENVAYILYTSGTTGYPKGIITEHKNLITYCSAFLNEFKLSSESIILQQASFSFDTFIEEVFPMFMVGGRVVVATPDIVMDVKKLSNYIIKNSISIIDCSPLLIYELGNVINKTNNLDIIISGGDVLKGEYLNNFVEQKVCYNTYGPTETTVCATFYQCKENKTGDVPIGKPIVNYEVLILNEHSKLVPIGYPGEICISGGGVVRGYINNVELTHEKFINNPYKLSQRIYKSGDFGKFDDNGIINFLGRKDNQVSLRGYRIELSEIENQLLKYNEIINAVVVSIDRKGDKYICSYFVSNSDVSDDQLRNYLAVRLPNYMIPSFFIRIENIPVNSNGKIEVKSLPDPFDSLEGMLTYINKSELNLAIDSCKQIVRKDKVEIEEKQFKLSDHEKEKLLIDFNNTFFQFDFEKHLVDLFDEQVKKNPHKTALVFNNSCYTYSFLDKCSSTLAIQIIKRGISSNSIIGLLTQRSPNMIIGMLGILKSGAAFMPLELEAPDERLQFIISNTNPDYVIVDDESVERNFNADKINISEINFSELVELSIDVERKSNDLTHVLHTSGSTGRPKGVLIENTSILNVFNYVRDLVNLNEHDNVLSMTPVTFDVFSAETLLPLILGSKVIILDISITLKVEKVLSILQKEKISFFQCSPTALQQLIPKDFNRGFFKGVKNVISAGEPLLDTVRKKFSDVTNTNLYNLYGPTETTLFSTGKDVSKGKSLNIGTPIYNTEVRIMNNSQKLLPINEEGEIYIGGMGVARGYINQPELTNELFKEIDDKRFYKTGDFAKWNESGEIDFIGRIDNQIQLGGIRIESGEIENSILSYPDVSEVAVVAKKDEKDVNYLVAYLVAGKRINESKIREYLSESIPLYIIPRKLIQLESMPYTFSRKINRKSLSEINIVQENKQDIYLPKSQTQIKLAEIWSEILDISKKNLNIKKNFFSLGGHSLKAVSMLTKIHKLFDIELSLKEVFSNSTIEELSYIIDAALLNREDNTIEGAEYEELKI